MGGRHRRALEGGIEEKAREDSGGGKERPAGMFPVEEGAEDAELAEAVRDANSHMGRKRDGNVVSWRWIGIMTEDIRGQAAKKRPH